MAACLRKNGCGQIHTSGECCERCAVIAAAVASTKEDRKERKRATTGATEHNEGNVTVIEEKTEVSKNKGVVCWRQLEMRQSRSKGKRESQEKEDEWNEMISAVVSRRVCIYVKGSSKARRSERLSEENEKGEREECENNGNDLPQSDVASSFFF